MLVEMVGVSVRTRGLPGYYFRHLLYRTDVENPLDYLTPEGSEALHSSLCTSAITPPGSTVRADPAALYS